MLEKSYWTVLDGKIVAWMCVRKCRCQASPSYNNKERVTDVSFQLKSFGRAFKVQSEYPYLAADLEKAFFLLKHQGGVMSFSGDSSALTTWSTDCHQGKAGAKSSLVPKYRSSCPPYRLVSQLSSSCCFTEAVGATWLHRERQQNWGGMMQVEE